MVYKKSLIFLILPFLFNACISSPLNSFAVETQDYGQCTMLKKGERIVYKRRLVSYVCEDQHVLLNAPYEIDDEWYFKSGFYNGKKVIDLSSTKVSKTIASVCSLEGAYGTGTKDIRKFYFNTKIKTCKPFSWSGENGIAPFKSQDECEVNCYY